MRKDRNRKAEIVKVLLDGQLKLRRLARERFAAELGIPLRGAAPDAFRFRPSPTSPSTADRRRALSIVDRFTNYASNRTRNTPTTELRRQAETAVQTRLRVIATNEAVRAFEEERRELAEAYARETEARGTKRWDAANDANTCDDCSSLGGTEIDLTDEFPDGDPPLHPNCRCSVEYFFDR